MIDKKSLSNALGISQRLTEQGITLGAVNQSALEHLTGSMKFIATKSDDFAQNALLVKEASHCIEHDGTMNFIADNAAVSVLNTHRLVVDKVNPHIRSVVDKIHARLAESEVEVEGLPVAELVSLPAVMDNDDLRELVSRIALADRYDTPVLDLGNYTDEEILDLIKYSKENNFDEILSMELVNNPESFKKINMVMAGTIFDLTRLSRAEQVATLLMSQALIHTDSIKEGIDATLAEYVNRLHWISVTVARDLQLVYSNWKAVVSGYFIYKPGTRNSNKIEVISETFHILSKEYGVTIEHLIGNHLLGRKYGYADLARKDNEDQLKETDAAYQKLVARLNTEKESKEHEKLIRTSLIVIKEDAIERSDNPECLEMLNDTKVSMINRATQACEAVFKSGRRIQKDKLDEFVAGLLIAIYYAHTDALLYLDSIANFTKQYPEMDGVELAKMARTNLIVHWVYRQIATIVKDPGTK